MSAVHCPDAPPGIKSKGSICHYRCKGPFASKPEEVTCKRCLSWPERVRKAFEVPVYTAGEAK